MRIAIEMLCLRTAPASFECRCEHSQRQPSVNGRPPVSSLASAGYCDRHTRIARQYRTGDDPQAMDELRMPAIQTIQGSRSVQNTTYHVTLEEGT